MKVGDLVKWTHPQAVDYGLVLKVADPTSFLTGQVFIEWHAAPDHSGYYPSDHQLLELISEG